MIRVNSRNAAPTTTAWISKKKSLKKLNLLPRQMLLSKFLLFWIVVSMPRPRVYFMISSI